MRKRGLDEIYLLAQKNPRVVFIGSDLGYKTLDDFKASHPKQFLMEGISEQNLIGMGAGLAQEGKIVYINTIATFLTRRCFDQLAMDVCVGNHNVRLYANGGGAVYAPLGPTHLAVDDIGLMRSLPNMTIIHPSDAEEMARAIQASEHHLGPIYFRLCRGGEIVTSDQKNGFEIGKAIVLKEPKELLFITNGTMVYRTLEVAKRLTEVGITAGVINVHTIKPIDYATLAPYLKKVPVIISVEEHNITGGLGSAVAELMAELPQTQKPYFKRMGFPDCYPAKYGQQDSMIKHYGININSIHQVALNMLKESRSL
jgi:transketolase